MKISLYELKQVQDLRNRIKFLTFHKLLPVNLTWLSQVYGRMFFSTHISNTKQNEKPTSTFENFLIFNILAYKISVTTEPIELKFSGIREGVNKLAVLKFQSNLISLRKNLKIWNSKKITS